MRVLLVFVFVSILALSGGAAWFFFGGLQDDARMEAEARYQERIDVKLTKAKTGDAKAAWDVAELFSNAPGTLRDLVKARKWYEKAAGAGVVKAQVKLARMYERGEGGTRNIERAIKWYRLAVRSGNNAEAAFRLGQIYFNGSGILQDQAKAFELYRLAAKNGHPVAQYLVANMYETGWGVEPDMVTAYAWYKLAAEKEDRIKAFNKNFDVTAALKRLSALISPSAVKQAGKKARALIPSQ